MWCRLDDQFFDLGEVAVLSDTAVRLLCTSMTESCRLGTDGFIAALLAPTLRRAPTGKAFARAVAELEQSGAWLVTEGGWQVSPTLWRNPTAAETEAKRQARAQAGAAGGRASGVTRRTNSEAIASANAKQTPRADETKTNPVPVPVPVPDQQTTTTGNARARLVVRGLDLAGKPIPRHDPFSERITFAAWFPWEELLHWAKASGLDGRDVDATLVEARDKLTGFHDFEWFDTKLIRFFEVAIQRKRAPAPQSGRTVRDGFDPVDWARGVRETEVSG